MQESTRQCINNLSSMADNSSTWPSVLYVPDLYPQLFHASSRRLQQRDQDQVVPVFEEVYNELMRGEEDDERNQQRPRRAITNRFLTGQFAISRDVARWVMNNNRTSSADSDEGYNGSFDNFFDQTHEQLLNFFLNRQRYKPRFTAPRFEKLWVQRQIAKYFRRREIIMVFGANNNNRANGQNNRGNRL